MVQTKSKKNKTFYAKWFSLNLLCNHFYLFIKAANDNLFPTSSLVRCNLAFSQLAYVLLSTSLMGIFFSMSLGHQYSTHTTL